MIVRAVTTGGNVRMTICQGLHRKSLIPGATGSCRCVDLELGGHVVLVAGGGAGLIGQAIVAGLREEGTRV